MNILAHLYLSGDNDEVLVGNFIGDAVKGRLNGQYASEIMKGIAMHRAIDSFTDTHVVVTESKARIRPVYGKYAGVVIDIFYDHFLSVDWHKYSDQNLKQFIRSSYFTLSQHFLDMPLRVQMYFPFFVANNWLAKYGILVGLERVLTGMGKHSSMPSNAKDAIEVLKLEYNKFHNEFNMFFPELRAMVCSLK